LKEKREKMRLFILILFTLLTAVLPGCRNGAPDGIIMTVKGPVSESKTGSWLPHEHILVDFIGADSVSSSRYDRQAVIKKVLPYLREAKRLGCNTFVDCTPEYLGRDAILLAALSDSTGLNILTNTGLYGAHSNKFMPKWAFKESAESLSELWIAEWKNGINGTGIKPGFIKIAVMPDSLSEFHRILVRAAALTHLATGLTIASHTGPALPAFQELDILEKEGVSPKAFIWVHAHQEKDYTKLAKAARRGAWISIDKISDENIDELVPVVKYMKNEGLLHNVLLSHDAGWYDPAKPDGGEFRGYTTLYNRFIPALRKNGFSDFEIRLLTEINPSRAFSVLVRRIDSKNHD
jgi:phosphotriesterase-related protein